MKIRDILELKGNQVLTLGTDASILKACLLMRSNYVGAIVVTHDDGSIAGILSERDIAVSLPAYGPALGETPVTAIMSHRVISCSDDMGLAEALDIMVSNGIRHLPVVEGETLKGLISLRDVVGNSLGAFQPDPAPERPPASGLKSAAG